MEIVNLKIDWDNLKQLVPEDYLEKAGITAHNYTKAIIFCAREKKESLGIGVFFPHKGSITVYELVYILVDEDRRGAGIAKEILLKSKELLAAADIQSILTSFYDEDTEDISPLLERVGFKKLRTHYMIAYTVGELMESKIGKELSILHKKLSPIKNYYEVDERARTRFFSEIRTKNTWINTAKIDRELSEFFIENGNIVGFLDAEKQDHDKIYVRGIYLFGNSSPQIIPMLLTKLMETVSKKYPSEALIGMEFENEKLGKAVIDTFGMPRELECLPVMCVELKND